MSRKSRSRLRHRRPRIRRRTPPGASPGTVKADPAAPRPQIRVIAYGSQQLVERQLESARDVKALVGQHPVVWVNVDGLGDADAIEQVGSIFGLHPLALEDVVNVHQLSKVDDYDQCLFIVARMPSRGEHLTTEQISLFLGKNFVLTFQERSGDCLEPVRQRIRHSRGRIRDARADYLGYAILDAVVDSYFPLVDGYGERLEAMEEGVSQAHLAGDLRELHALRSDLMLIRRNVRPLRETLLRLTPQQSSLISPDTSVYLRDCYDHTIQILDLLETYRDLSSDLRDFHLATASQRMNEVMKVLTIIATIFIPLSFVAGVYGMNFDVDASPWNMPELKWPLGYPLALSIMAGIAAAMLAFFKRKGWLGAPSRPRGSTQA